MSTYTVDDSGQIIVTPSELDQFEYYRDNILVRRFQESINFDYAELLSSFNHVGKIFPNGDCFGVFASVLDSSNIVHCIVASNTDIWYVYGNETWEQESISTNRGGGLCAITLDSSEKLHVFYHNTQIDQVCYSTNATGSWVEHVLELVDSIGYNACEILLDSLEKVHIFYTSYPDVIRHATNATGSWVIETIDTLGGNCYVLAACQKSDLDTFVLAYSYLGGSDMTIATGSWGSWSIADTGVCDPARPGITILADSSNNIHLFYGAWGSNYSLRHANDEGGWSDDEIWKPATVSYQRVNAKIIDGDFYILFAGSSPDESYYGTNNTGLWNFEPVFNCDDAGWIYSGYDSSFELIDGRLNLYFSIREYYPGGDNIHKYLAKNLL